MPIFSQLQQVESDIGRIDTVSGDTRSVHGIFGLFSANNLGAYRLLDF